MFKVVQGSERIVMNLEELKQIFERTPVIEYPHRVMQPPLVSVCIQAYQHREFIETCLTSILAQETTFPYEILVGEDSSTDGTREICIRYAKDYPDKIRLFLHNRSNNIIIDGTVTGRFNFAYNLLSAKGEYIALCEGDDFWTDPLKLQRQIDYMESNPQCSLSCHNTSLLDQDTQEITDVRPGVPEETEILVKDLIRSNRLATASFVLRRGIVKNLPEWFVKIPFGDYGLLILSGLVGKIMCLPENMAVYRYHSGGIHSTLFETSEGAIKALRRQFSAAKILQAEVFRRTEYEPMVNRKMRSILKTIYSIHVESHNYFRALLTIIKRTQIRLAEKARRMSQLDRDRNGLKRLGIARGILRLILGRK